MLHCEPVQLACVVHILCVAPPLPCCRRLGAFYRMVLIMSAISFPNLRFQNLRSRKRVVKNWCVCVCCRYTCVSNVPAGVDVLPRNARTDCRCDAGRHNARNRAKSRPRPNSYRWFVGCWRQGMTFDIYLDIKKPILYTSLRLEPNCVEFTDSWLGHHGYSDIYWNIYVLCYICIHKSSCILKCGTLPKGDWLIIHIWLTCDTYVGRNQYCFLDSYLKLPLCIASTFILANLDKILNRLAISLVLHGMMRTARWCE